MFTSHHLIPLNIFLILSLSLVGPVLMSQDLQLVWADEFDGSVPDRSVWQFESGLTNDNVHYYIDRTDNARIVDGKLQIIALEESYQGFNYTSALLKTEHTFNWKYGRIEALIKLPETPGFVPAFWMLPSDNTFGWWPFSGEIDIMEHPTNEITTIYGTVHTETYNLFSGSSPPQGSTIDIPDVASAFHLYAVEWTADKIDFYVDDQKYYTFFNDQGSSATWPFDKPFYLILNLAVGGGWVGEPNENTVFPAIMEVDYVRVYQDISNTIMQGADFVTYDTEDSEYSLGNFDGADYLWSVPGDAKIISGQHTPGLTVDWGIFGGNIEALITSGEGSYTIDYPVMVSSNLLKNPGFEKGVKYWNKSIAYPVEADFTLISGEMYRGDQSLRIRVTEPGANAWDVQLSQGRIQLQGGTLYHASFWARTEGGSNNITAAIINDQDYSLVVIETFTLSETWTKYTIDFIPSSSNTVAFNLDLGDHTGSYYFDDFELTTSRLANMNLLTNPDFFNDDADWTLTTHATAEATGDMIDGMYAVSINNGGDNAWDIHLGQTGVLIENGKEYLVTFDAYAEAPRQITALVGKNADPWTVYSGSQLISLTTTPQTHTFSFVMTEPTDPQSRIGFDLGGNTGDVFIDNIALRQVDATDLKPFDNEIPSHLNGMIQNYPNPFLNQTTFVYNLPEPADVRLRVFNLIGQEIEVLINDFQQKGDHEFTWFPDKLSSGIYFYQFELDGHSDTGKLILLQ